MPAGPSQPPKGGLGPAEDDSQIKADTAAAKIAAKATDLQRQADAMSAGTGYVVLDIEKCSSERGLHGDGVIIQLSAAIVDGATGTSWEAAGKVCPKSNTFIDPHKRNPRLSVFLFPQPQPQPRRRVPHTHPTPPQTPPGAWAGDEVYTIDVLNLATACRHCWFFLARMRRCTKTWTGLKTPEAVFFVSLFPWGVFSLSVRSPCR